MGDKPFIRVKDKRTKHQYDIHRQKFDPEKHELVKRIPDAWRPRRPKPFVTIPVAEPKPVSDGSSNTTETVGQTQGVNDE